MTLVHGWAAGQAHLAQPSTAKSAFPERFPFPSLEEPPELLPVSREIQRHPDEVSKGPVRFVPDRGFGTDWKGGVAPKTKHCWLWVLVGCAWYSNCIFLYRSMIYRTRIY